MRSGPKEPHNAGVPMDNESGRKPENREKTRVPGLFQETLIAPSANRLGGTASTERSAITIVPANISYYQKTAGIFLLSPNGGNWRTSKLETSRSLDEE